jgi:hypothetical protein
MPVIAAIPFASAGGLWLGQALARIAGTLRDFVVSSLHLSPLALASVADFARSGVLWLFIPTLLLALIQSYWLFRTPRQKSALWMLRSVLPLVAATILWSFSASAGFLSSQWEPFAETSRAIDQFQAGRAKLDLTGEDLTNGSPVTALTERWLKGSSITVAPDQSHPSGYLATIRLASGLECRLTVTPYGGTVASCGKV